MALDQILNYPNPFREDTKFIIGHNQAGRDLEIHIEIINLAGQTVKNLKAAFNASGV